MAAKQQRIRNIQKNISKLTGSFAVAFAKEDDENEIFLAQTVDLNSDEVTVRSLTFDEMVEEVAIKTGNFFMC